MVGRIQHHHDTTKQKVGRETIWPLRSPRQRRTHGISPQTPRNVEEDPSSLQRSSPYTLQTARLPSATTTTTSTTRNRQRRRRIRSGRNPRFTNEKFKTTIPSPLEGLSCSYRLDLGTGMQYHACARGDKGFPYQKSISTLTTPT